MSVPTLGVRLCLLCLMLFGLAAGPGCEKAEESVRKSWGDYKDALVTKDGNKAASLVTNGTIQYFERLRERAVEAEESELRAMKPFQQAMVLMLRHQLGVDRLRGVDGRGLYAVISVGEDFVAFEDLDGMSIQSVKVDDGDFARLFLMKDGRRDSEPLRVVREKGAWKLDMEAMMVVAERHFADMVREIEQSGEMTTDEFFLMILEETSGKPATPDIWKKPE